MDSCTPIIIVESDHARGAHYHQQLAPIGHPFEWILSLDYLTAPLVLGSPIVAIVGLAADIDYTLAAVAMIRCRYACPVIIVAAEPQPREIIACYQIGASWVCRQGDDAPDLLQLVSECIDQNCEHLGRGIASPEDHPRLPRHGPLQDATGSPASSLITPEHRLLTLLTLNAGIAVRDRTLLYAAFGTRFVDEPDVLHTAIDNLRAAIGDSAHAPRLLMRCEGPGYLLAPAALRRLQSHHPLTATNRHGLQARSWTRDRRVGPSGARLKPQP